MPKPRSSSRGSDSGRSKKKTRAKPKAPDETGSGSSTNDVAAALGISPDMVRKLRARGMPGQKVKGSLLFDLESCKAWYSAHRKNSGHGGVRPGTGRKRTRWVDTEAKPTQDEAKTSPRAVAAAAATVDADVETEDLARLTSAELQQKKLIEEVLMLRVKRQKEEAELINVHDMRKSLSNATAALSRSLRQVGKSIAGIVIDTVGAEPSMTETVRQIIDEQLDQALGELAQAMVHSGNSESESDDAR